MKESHDRSRGILTALLVLLALLLGAEILTIVRWVFH